MTRSNKLVVAMSLAMTAVALEEQLKLPPAQRTWHGNILGVPYDFRPPTRTRVRSAMWDPNNRALVIPMVFGIGWSLNLYRLAHPAAFST